MRSAAVSACPASSIIWGGGCALSLCSLNAPSAVGYSQEEDRSSPCCSETERESFPSFSYSVYGRCYRCSLRPFSRAAHHGNVGGERTCCSVLLRLPPFWA